MRNCRLCGRLVLVPIGSQMMGDLNRLELIGTVVRGPKLERVGQQSRDLVKIVLKVQETERANPSYPTVIAWEKLARQVSTTVSVGDVVYVSGKIQSFEFETRSGKGKGHNLVARQVEPLRRRGEAAREEPVQEERPRAHEATGGQGPSADTPF